MGHHYFAISHQLIHIYQMDQLQKLWVVLPILKIKGDLIVQCFFSEKVMEVGDHKLNILKSYQGFLIWKEFQKLNFHHLKNFLKKLNLQKINWWNGKVSYTWKAIMGLIRAWQSTNIIIDIWRFYWGMLKYFIILLKSFLKINLCLNSLI